MSLAFHGRARSASLGVLGVALLFTVAFFGWTNRNHIDALITNRIAEPSEAETTEAQLVDVDEPPLVRLAVVGDTGTGGPEAYKTAESIDAADEQYPFDALLLLGDVVYPEGDPERIDEKLYTPFKSVLDNDAELLAVLGNHDVAGGTGDGMRDALGMPENWYAKEFEQLLVVGLDSNQPANQTQLDWLDKTLSQSRAKWTIAIFHHPPYSGGWHGGNNSVKDHFVPLFQKYDVELALSGHEHDYQRTEAINNTTYIVSGAGSKLRRTGTEDFTESAWGTYHFVDLRLYEDRIEAQAIDHDGRAIDTFTVGPN